MNVVASLRCHYCSKFRSPSEVFQLGAGGARICSRCRQWHEKAMRSLATGQPPEGCQDCGITFRQLADQAGDVRMVLHIKDGVYQIMCQACSRRYIPKRGDLFRDTAFGRSLNLT